MPCLRIDSYPPVTQFEVGVGQRELMARILGSNDDPIPRPLTLALHLPCSSRPEFAGDVERLRREMDLVARLVDRDREVIELHVGTDAMDSPWRQAYFSDLMEALRHQFHVSSAAASELTIHADPRVLRSDEIALLAAAGFNRMAFSDAGIDPLLAHSCRSVGFQSLAVTIAEALSSTPGAGDRPELDTALAVRPDRLMVREPAGDARMHRAEATRASLEFAGYDFIGPEQYALPHEGLSKALRAGRLRYGPLGYTPQPECDWLGFGPGAVSLVGDYHAWNARDRTLWRHGVDRGRLPVHAGRVLTTEDRVRVELIQQLMCRRKIAIRELEDGHDIEFRHHFATELARFESFVAAGFASDHGECIVVGSRGWPWLRKMAACFECSNIGAMSREAAQAS